MNERMNVEVVYSLITYCLWWNVQIALINGRPRCVNGYARCYTYRYQHTYLYANTSWSENNRILKAVSHRDSSLLELKSISTDLLRMQMSYGNAFRPNHINTNRNEQTSD